MMKERSERMLKQITVHGRVQGVGFRMSAKQVADRHGITGQVQNKEDGTVEIIAQGEEEKIQEFIKKIENGPAPAADVTKTDVTDLDGPGNFQDFEVVG
ncbi:acylphosphatase [Salimicrobium jeotgali]|uniref:acylphosphatase n=2 Tax=Salimicrobium TaxID=351195 RepID=K2GQM3_9BACI|nr:acylphosphatase [Salimicrobium jeotgali]EKE32659.1 acylphosphatase [Salimicrobium jeotgali]